MVFDKGRPLTKEFCEECKKEIKPGGKMIISLITPSHLMVANKVLYQERIQNAPKYHEECYLKKSSKE